jgi:hypothetical protein
MNIQLIDEISKQLENVEKMILDIDGKIDKISPDLSSTIMFKKNFLEILDHIKTAKEDIASFHEGRAIFSNSDIIKAIMDKIRKDQGGGSSGPHDDGSDGHKGFPPSDFQFPPDEPL